MQKLKWLVTISYVLMIIVSIFMVLISVFLVIFIPAWILGGDGSGGWGGWEPVLRIPDILFLIFCVYQLIMGIGGGYICRFPEKAKICIAMGIVGILLTIFLTSSGQNASVISGLRLLFVIYTISAYFIHRGADI